MNPASLPARVVDVILLVVACVIALLPFGDAFGGQRWLVAAVAGLVVAVGASLLAARLRWGPLLTVLVAVLGYLLVGPAAAAPHQAAAGLLPSMSAERLLVTGIVESWRSVLTLPVPLGSGRGELVVPFATALLGGLLAATLLLRTRVAGLVCLPVIGLFLTAGAFGTRDAEIPLARGLLLVVLLIAWLRWRSLRLSPSAWLRRVALAGALVGVTGSASWGLTSFADAGEREVVRDHVEPPLADLTFKSPLAKYRFYYKDHKNDVLFTFEGLPSGAPDIRLAAMDTYDGSVWNVSTTAPLTGSSAFRAAPYRDSGSTITVTIGEYDGPWVPTVGVATGAHLETSDDGDSSRELLLNAATGSVAMYGNAHPGEVYRIEWEPRTRRAADLASVPADLTVPVPPMPFEPIETLDRLTQRAVGKAGARTDFDRAVAVEAFFRDKGYFNDGDDPVRRGYSASGHSLRRLSDLVADEERMVGNDEQYAAAMAYAVQRMGIPARVVLGFEEVGGDGTVTGDDIAAWVEIPFEGRGWIVFDPTPNENRIPPPQQDDPNPKPQPYVVQPPVLPQEPAEIQGVPPDGVGRDLTDESGGIVAAILHWLWAGTKVVLLLSPLWLVLLVKRVRRRRRRRAADPVVRLCGAWREITDRARDLGTRVSSADTRHETGQVLATRFPACEHPVLAATADRHVFGPGVPTDDEVTSYWADVDTALKRMRRAVPWWRRPLAWLSPASIPWRSTGRSIAVRLRSISRRLTALPRRLNRSGKESA